MQQRSTHDHSIAWPISLSVEYAAASRSPSVRRSISEMVQRVARLARRREPLKSNIYNKCMLLLRNLFGCVAERAVDDFERGEDLTRLVAGRRGDSVQEDQIVLDDLPRRLEVSGSNFEVPGQRIDEAAQRAALQLVVHDRVMHALA